MGIYVCVLTHNRLEKVRRCIQSILPAVEKEGGRLWVLDQGSTDGTAEWLWERRKMEQIELTLSRHNHMAIGGRQRQVDGLLHNLEGDDWVVFLDSDVEAADVDWLVRLVEAPGDINGVYGRNISSGWGGFKEPVFVPDFVDVVSGGMTAVLGAVLLDGCAYDLDYLPFWHGDSDFCLQARANGYQVYCVGDVGLQHEAEHREPDAQYWKNWERMKSKWMGKGVVMCEYPPPAPPHTWGEGVGSSWRK